MRKIGGVIEEVTERYLDDPDHIIMIYIKPPDFDPHSTIAVKERNQPAINLPADPDYFPGPRDRFPAGQGVSDADRRIIVLMHELGHNVLKLEDPVNVNFENIAREELDVPLRTEYRDSATGEVHSPIPPFDDRTQRRIDILKERALERANERE